MIRVMLLELKCCNEAKVLKIQFYMDWNDGKGRDFWTMSKDLAVSDSNPTNPVQGYIWPAPPQAESSSIRKDIQ